MIAFESSWSRFLVAALCCSAVLGCNRQQEGERCALTNADSDCDDDLLCTEAENLRGGDDEVDRCCPDSDETPSDSRCALKTSAGDGDGDGPITGQGGGGGATSGEDDPPAGLGDACQYNSECVEPLVCGPGGQCQYECNVDRDCDGGETCSDERACVAASE
jgi:hypothetical protein